MYSIQTLFREEDDKIAKVLHEKYYEEQIKKGFKRGEKPALVPWDKLPGEFKESNRQAADHIPVKLRALSYQIDRLPQERAAETAFRQEQVELLAKMEHDRWNAEKWLLGYEHGDQRKDQEKIHPNLVTWKDLADDVKDYDREQVKGIPEALERAGYGIYPQF
jgi:hypothetical protein